MKNHLQGLNLVDLLSERHLQLRRKVNTQWHERGMGNINQTESHMLSIIEKESVTIAESARKMNFTRQAAHKCAQGLIEKGFIDFIRNNQRDKSLILTEKGKNYCSDTLLIKHRIEKEIAEKIGQDNLILIKNLLQTDWYDTSN
ncbi:MarR family transcriptional regulator [Neobacillus drentensis]|uniref:MarR family transcriptional regulator n=1 Tax=Neobacillus drentensis TaxID=220684 RepID=UPI0030000AF4